MHIWLCCTVCTDAAGTHGETQSNVAGVYQDAKTWIWAPINCDKSLSWGRPSTTRIGVERANIFPQMGIPRTSCFRNQGSPRRNEPWEKHPGWSQAYTDPLSSFNQIVQFSTRKLNVYVWVIQRGSCWGQRFCGRSSVDDCLSFVWPFWQWRQKVTVVCAPSGGRFL